jgi:hypothetical protein
VEEHLLFGGDEVGVVVVAGFDEDPVDGAGEGGPGAVVGDDAGAGVLADVGGLVGGEPDRDRGLEATLGDLVALDEKCDGGAFGESAAVVGGLHAHLVGAGRDRVWGFDVAVGRLAKS